MNGKTHRDLVLSIFRSAIDSQPAPVPEGPHFVDDDELLARWASDQLTPDDREQIIDHLAVCPYCRNELAELIGDGVLESPEADDEAADSAPPAKTATLPLPDRFRQPAPWTRMLLAASVLFSIVGLLWYLNTPGPEAMLAMAELDLQQGRASRALEEVDGLLDRELDPNVQAGAERLLERAGYEMAGSELAAGNWKRVKQIDSRVSRRVGASARLLNLRFQADREIPAELTMAHQGSLLDYGYEPDGRLPQKAMPEQNEVTDNLYDEFPQAVSEHADEVVLRLNYGEFLLSQRENGEAREQFSAALRLDPQNAHARLGLGLCDFSADRYKEALEHFQASLGLAANLVAGHVNAAVCLEKLSRSPEARSHWQRVIDLSDDATLRRRIEAHLSDNE